MAKCDCENPNLCNHGRPETMRPSRKPPREGTDALDETLQFAVSVHEIADWIRVTIIASSNGGPIIGQLVANAPNREALRRLLTTLHDRLEKP